MIREYPNGDSAEVKGLTVTVKLGEESMSKIREAALDEIDALRAENAKLRELISDMWRFTGVACKKYPRLFDPSAQCGQMVQLNRIDSFEQRMSELGIKED